MRYFSNDLGSHLAGALQHLAIGCGEAGAPQQPDPAVVPSRAFDASGELALSVVEGVANERVVKPADHELPSGGSLAQVRFALSRPVHEGSVAARCVCQGLAGKVGLTCYQ